MSLRQELGNIHKEIRPQSERANYRMLSQSAFTNSILMDSAARLPRLLGRVVLLLNLCKFPIRDRLPPRVHLCGTPPEAGSAYSLLQDLSAVRFLDGQSHLSVGRDLKESYPFRIARWRVRDGRSALRQTALPLRPNATVADRQSPGCIWLRYPLDSVRARPEILAPPRSSVPIGDKPVPQNSGL